MEAQFHTVDLSTIKQITVEDILSAKGTPTENLDYSSPIPVRSISIPHQNSDMGFNIVQIECGAIDYGAIAIGNAKFEQYRGRLGC